MWFASLGFLFDFLFCVFRAWLCVWSCLVAFGFCVLFEGIARHVCTMLVRFCAVLFVFASLFRLFDGSGSKSPCVSLSWVFVLPFLSRVVLAVLPNHEYKGRQPEFKEHSYAHIVSLAIDVGSGSFFADCGSQSIRFPELWFLGIGPFGCLPSI